MVLRNCGGKTTAAIVIACDGPDIDDTSAFKNEVP
jgi:hypothetical protein